jgi:beta-galactosidase
MKSILQLIIATIFILFIGCRNEKVRISRQTIKINQDWRFIMDSTNQDFSLVNIDDKKWETVTLPHTPRIEPLVVNNQWQGTCWYRKHLNIDQNELGKKIFLKFEGVMQVAHVWINGSHKMFHAGGYLPFLIDISDNVIEGDNVISVKLINTDDPQVPPGKALNVLDFCTYGGIYRSVEMISTNKLYITDPILSGKIAGGGVFITTDIIDSTKAIITIQTNIKNENIEEKRFSVVNYILTKDGDTVSVIKSEEQSLISGNDKHITQKAKINQPRLWHPDSPYLYRVKTMILDNGEESDVIETCTGIRKIELKPEGFYINGSRLFIRGTNRHQEYPYVGYALSDEAQYRDAVKIKNAGFDFVRCSHYPHSEAFLNACDELGIFVMNSIPGWQFMGDSVFCRNSLNDCRDLVRRDRNHPAIIFWEVSLNETQMDESYMDEANQILDEELPTQVYSAGWVDYAAYDLFIPARQHAAPPSYWNNYKTGQKPLFIAEYGDWEYYAQDAGFNQTAFKNLKPEERTSRQLRAYGEKRMLQQALNYQEAINSNQKGKTLIGEANWLMFDYNRGYADDIEASGISDIFRIPKFSYYFFKSQRPPVKLNIPGIESGPMVYIASYWDSLSTTDVKIYSNCEEVALYLNDKLIETKKHDNDKYSQNLDFPPFTFSVNNYEKGKLAACGFIGNKAVAFDSVITPEEPVTLGLEFDSSNMPVSRSDKDIVFIYARILDKNGTVCPINDIQINFSVEGNARLIGSNPAKCEAGIASIILETNNFSDKITLQANSEGLKPSTIYIE